MARSCRICGELISAKRLEVKPNAQECVPCLTNAGDVATYSDSAITRKVRFEDDDPIDATAVYSTNRNMEEANI